jgi:uncharacterized protein DUF4397
MFRPSYLLAAVPLAFLAACGDKDTGGIVGVGTAATVRFVNATNGAITVANNGAVATGSNGLVFGNTSACLPVTSNALTLTDVSGNTITGFTPSFAAGGNYTVIAYTDANGNTQFATLPNSFTPASGSAGLRIFNAASGQPSLTFANNGTALGSTVVFGSASDFVNVPSGSDDITFLNGGSMILDAGSMNLSPGTTSTIVVGPAATGSTTLRSFSVAGC